MSRRTWVWMIALTVATAWFWFGRENTGPRERTARLWADAPYYYAYLPSVALDHDLTFTNQYRVTKNFYGLGKAPSGRPGNVFGIGPAVFAAPAWGIGHALARVSGAREDGFSTLEIKLTLFVSVLATFGALVFTARLLRRRLRLRGTMTDIGLVLAMAIATPVAFYAIRQPGYAHPFATFWVAWLVDRWDRSFDDDPAPRDLRTWLGLGALLGAAALARPQVGLWAVILLVAAVDDVRRWARGDRTPRRLLEVGGRWLAGAAVALVVFAPQLLAWKALYGAYYVVPQGDGFMRWDAPAISEVLFSARNGLFAWSPLAALGVLGVLAMLRVAPRLAGALLLGFGTQIVANGAVWDWWAGGSFGGRRFDSCFVVFALGAGFVVAALLGPHRRRTVRAATAVSLTLLAGLVIASATLTAHYDPRTARIDGGQPAAQIMRTHLPRPFGALLGAASNAATFPARAAFSLRYDLPYGRYDRVVGVHLLPELYPGLNATRPRPFARVRLDEPHHPLVTGIARTADGVARSRRRTTRILVPLNRTGAVALTLVVHPPTDGLTFGVRWNDTSLPVDTTTTAPTLRVHATALTLRRGINVLELDAPIGTAFSHLELVALP